MARGDVLLVDLPFSEKREQSGRRPAVAVQTDLTGEPMLMIAPITSNSKALRFKFAVQIEPSPENGLDVPSVVMIFQMRSMDKSRVLKQIGRLSDEDMRRVDTEIWKMLQP